MRIFEIAYRLGGQVQASFLRSMNTASQEFRHMYDQMQRMENRFRNGRAGMNDFQRGLMRMTAQIGAGAFALNSFKKAIDFEQQISSIQAVSGMTKVQMGKIEELSLEMGAKTKYSALEAAQGIEELVKAGLSMEKISGGGIEAALNLAAAGDLGLADAAEIMSTALNAFRSDSMKASEAADILAGTANASATNVMELRFALQMSSAVAAGVGMKFKDTATALGLFANNGLKGSDSGTSLKTMLLNLTPVTADAIGEFERLGLMTFDAGKALQFLTSEGVKPASTATRDVVDAFMTYSAKAVNAKVGTDKANKSFREMAFNAGAMSSVFYDSAGELQNLEVIAGELQKSLKGLTSQQRQVSMKTMFGTDAVRAANILYKEGAEGVRNFYDEASRVTALEVATTRLDNAKGSVELFRSAMETLQITAMKTLSPALKKVADLGTEIASKHGKAVIAFGGLALAAYPLAKVTQGVIALTRAVGGFGVVMRVLSGPVGWTIAAVTAIGVGFAFLSSRSKRATEDLVNMGEKMRTALGNYQEVDKHSKRIDYLISEYDRLKTKVSQAKAPADELAEARRKLQGIEEELISLNPDILSAEDAKTGRFREQLGLLQEQNKVKKDMAMRELQESSLNFKASISDSKNDYQKLMADKPRLEAENRSNFDMANKLTELHSIFKDTMNRKARKVITNEQANAIFDDLKKQAEEITGQEMKYGTAEIGDWKNEFTAAFNETNEALRGAEEKMTAISDSIRTAYASAKSLAEMEAGLEMPIEQAAKKYNTLTSEQKAKTEQVIKKLQEFKDQLDGLPDQKQIDLSVMYRAIGQVPPDIKPPSTRSVPTVPGGFQAYADGGIATSPHMGIFAEQGPEAMIPLAANKRNQAMSLYDKVGKALGVRDYSSGGLKSKLQGSGVSAPAATPINLSFGDFVVNVQGSADEGALAQIRREMEQHKSNILAAIQEATRQKGRVRLA